MNKTKIERCTVLISGCILVALILLMIGAAFLFGDINDGMGIIFSVAFSVFGVSFVFGLTNGRVSFKFILPLAVCLLSLAYTFITVKWPINSVWDLFYYTLYYGGISVVSVGVGTVINLIVRAIARFIKNKKQRKKADLS